MSESIDLDGGPTVPELLAIEAEWPVHAAELAVVEAECRFMLSPDVLARRALRRAVTALTRVYAELYGPPAVVAREPQEVICEGVMQ